MSEREVLLDVQELSVDFRVDRKTTLRAVREVSFQVYKGETLGILGESGCGKSVTCMSILRLEPEKTTAVSQRQDFVWQSGSADAGHKGNWGRFAAMRSV